MLLFALMALVLAACGAEGEGTPQATATATAPVGAPSGTATRAPATAAAQPVTTVTAAARPTGTAATAPTAAPQPTRTPVQTQAASTPPRATATAVTQRASTSPTAIPSDLHRVRGQASLTIPYAGIEAASVVARVITKDGGVIAANLPGGVRMYLVIPEKLIIQTAAFTILPYREMPTLPDHPPMSDQLGYGVLILADTSQAGLRGGWVVFDTTGGAAQLKEERTGGIFNRCDPGKSWFNATICAGKRRVLSSGPTEEAATVVTPVYNVSAPMLVRQTVSVGVEGLLVTEYTGSGVYLPQKLDRGHADELVRVSFTKPVFTTNKIEAAALALVWGLNLSDDHLIDAARSIEPAGTRTSFRKSLMVAHVYKPTFQTRVAVASQTASRSPNDLTLRFKADDMAEAIAQAGRAPADAASTPNGGYREGTKTATTGRDASVPEAAANAQGMADAGIEGAADAAAQVTSALDNRISNPPRNGTPLNVFEARGLLDAPTGTDFPSRAGDAIDDTLGNSGSSISDLLQALALAQQLGLDDGLEGKILDKIRSQLQAGLNSPGLCKSQLLQLAATAQAVGMDDIADQALKKAETASAECVCDELIKKNLKTFGINSCSAG